MVELLLEIEKILNNAPRNFLVDEYLQRGEIVCEKSHKGRYNILDIWTTLYARLELLGEYYGVGLQGERTLSSRLNLVTNKTSKLDSIIKANNFLTEQKNKKKKNLRKNPFVYTAEEAENMLLYANLRIHGCISINFAGRFLDLAISLHKKDNVKK